MMRVIRVLVLVLIAVVVMAGGYGAMRNPEHITLDKASRDTASGAFVQLRDGVTHYEAGGPTNARVVVLVHGFSVPQYIWDSTFNALTAAGLHVVRYDLFGRGWSDRPDAAYDGAMYDEQLNGLLDSLRVAGPIDLMGLSFGGFVVAHYTSTHPQRVRTVTLVDPVSSTRVMPSWLSTPVVGEWVFQTTQVPGMADNQASDFLHPERFPGWADKYRVQMQFRGFGRALLRTAFTLSRTNFDTLYSAVGRTHIPTLLVWGQQDPTVPIALSAAARNHIPGLEWFPVDSSGHLPHIEQSKSVHARMLQFLESHPASAPPVP